MKTYEMECGCVHQIGGDGHFEDVDICDEHSSDDCMDCRQNVFKIGEYYMLTDGLWSHITTEREEYGMLCIGCVENRLGRMLNRDDFNHSPLNHNGFDDKSARLCNRLVRPDCECDGC